MKSLINAKMPSLKDKLLAQGTETPIKKAAAAIKKIIKPKK